MYPKERCRNLPCLICKAEINPENFYWYTRANKTLRRRSWCKKCQSDRKKEIYYKDLRKELDRSRKWKSVNKPILASIQARRRASILQRTPSWANREEIAKFYQEASKLGVHVDHIIPLNGKLVSGLHVEDNLQLLSATENHRKRNRFRING